MDHFGEARKGPREMDEGSGGLHSEACRGSKLTGDKIRPTGKAFDDILTGDHGGTQYRILEMGNKIEEQDFRIVHREMVQVRSNRIETRMSMLKFLSVKL